MEGRYNLKSTYYGAGVLAFFMLIVKSLAHFPPSCGTGEPRYFSFSAESLVDQEASELLKIKRLCLSCNVECGKILLLSRCCPWGCWHAQIPSLACLMCMGFWR